MVLFITLHLHPRRLIRSQVRNHPRPFTINIEKGLWFSHSQYIHFNITETLIGQLYLGEKYCSIHFFFQSELLHVFPYRHCILYVRIFLLVELALIFIYNRCLLIVRPIFTLIFSFHLDIQVLPGVHTKNETHSNLVRNMLYVHILYTDLHVAFSHVNTPPHTSTRTHGPIQWLSGIR